MLSRSPILMLRIGLLASVTLLLAPQAAQAWPGKNSPSCAKGGCHVQPSATATITTAIDGVVGTSVTVAPGGSFEIDYKVDDITNAASYDSCGVQAGVPSGWTASPGTSNAPAITGWSTSWDAAAGVGYTTVSVVDPYPNSPDGYFIDFAGSAWDNGTRDAAFDDGSTGDQDGVADSMGTDLIVNVPGGATPGAYEVVVLAAGHEGGTKAHIVQTISVTVAAGATTTLGPGTEPGANPSVGPGAAEQLVSRFSLAASTGTDTVTALNVTLAAGTSAGVAQVVIEPNGGGAAYGTQTTPAGEVWSFTGLSVPVTTTATDFEVRVTPKTHANMPAVPGGTYAVTATVSGVVAGNSVTGSDTGSDTVTIDNLSPADATWGAINPADSQIGLNWTNPGGDFASTLILRNSAAISDFPVEGNTSYTAGGTIGTSFIQYVGAALTTTATGLINGNNYYFKAFTRDANGNWAAGAQTGPHQPVANQTQLSAGTDPAASPAVGPGGAEQLVSRFGLQTTSGTDTVTALDVTLAAGTSAGVAQVVIEPNGGGAPLGTQTTPAGEVWSFTGLSLAANTGLTEYEVRVTPKAHGAMPAVPGGSYAVTAAVSNLTAGNTVTGTDTGSDTLTIDNLSPSDATWGAINLPASGQIELNWTNPGGDFASTLILRNSAAISDFPVEGNTSYTAGGNIGTSFIQYVGAASTTTATGLINGNNYYFKAFTRDANGNWAAGAQTGPHQPVADPTTLGPGTEPGVNPTVAPQSSEVVVSRFSLGVASGSDTVSAMDATLAAGTSAGVAQVRITDVGATTTYGTDATPTGETWSFAAMGLPVTTTPTDFEVRITPKTHAAMPAVPGAAYAVTATVGNLTAGNSVTGTDTGSDTVTIDNLSPNDATWGANSPGDTQVSLNWTNPGGDFAEVMILRSTATISDTPVEGTTYTQGNSLGGSFIQYVNTGTSTTATGLVNSQPYYFKAFTRDTNGNWAAGVEDGPIAPLADTTLLSAGTDPAAGPTLAPGGAKTLVSRFGLATSNGTDTVTALDVTLAAGTSVGVATVEITGNGGSPSYGTDSLPAGETWSITGAIPVTTTVTDFEVHVTPKSHAAMPGVPGGSYAVTAIVGNLSATNTVSGSDTGSDTLTIDNLSPGDSSWGVVTAGDTQVSLNWTNPGGDFADVMVLRDTASITATPVEGSTYTQGASLGGSFIQYVSTGTSTTATGLTNGQDYYFKTFARDASGNWAAGAQTGPHQPQAVVTTLGAGTDPAVGPTLAPSGAETVVSRFSLQTSTGTDTITGLDATFSGGSIGVAQVRITGNGGAPIYGTDTTPSGELWSFTGMSLPATTTLTDFEVRLTPKTHAAMPAVPGATYVATATVGNLVMGNALAGSDSGSDTVTIDNTSPGDATWGAINPGDTTLDLHWTNPGGDFAETMVLRHTASIVVAPTEGSTYVQGNSLGGTFIQYVGPLATHLATGLTNGQDYYFKAFTRDGSGNWAAGVQTGPHQSTLVDSDAPCAAADLQVTTTTDTSIEFTFTAPWEDCTGTSGNPTSYMVRYDHATIDLPAWPDALIFNDTYAPVVAPGATETITITGLDSNTRYYIQVRAVDDFSNVGPLAVPLAADTDQTHSTLHTGWNMGGNENNLTTTNTCLGVFGVTSCMYWVSSGVSDWAGSYSDTGSGGVVQDGYGYWLGMTGGESLSPPGDSTVTATQVQVPLQKGMNLIANPHPDSVPLANLTITQNGTVTNSWANAIVAGWIVPSVYAYDGTNYFPEVWDSVPAGKMHPRKAYWLKLAVDDANTYTVEIPKP